MPTVKELKKFLKDKGVRGYSKFRKYTVVGSGQNGENQNY